MSCSPARFASSTSALVGNVIAKVRRRRLHVVSHNLLSDAHMSNFTRDVEIVNGRARDAGLPLTFAEGEAAHLSHEV